MLSIRQAVESDVAQIATLIQSVMHLFFAEASGKGADRFIASTTPDALQKFIKRVDIDYLVGEKDGEFCGCVAIRDNKHLQHLFVMPHLQANGIGRQLWSHASDRAMAAGNPGLFTVNASRNAVPVYLKFGFEVVGELQLANGVIFQAMKLSMDKQKMTKQLISSGSVFEEQMGYSRAVVVAPWIFVSGTTGFDYSNMTISDDIVQQTEQCFLNIEAALIKAQSSLKDVVRVHYILPVAGDFEKCWPVMKKYFGDIKPAATMFGAGLADARIKIEIEVTALKTVS